MTWAALPHGFCSEDSVATLACPEGTIFRPQALYSSKRKYPPSKMEMVAVEFSLAGFPTKCFSLQ